MDPLPPETLPKCPLCGAVAVVMGATDAIVYAHPRNGCGLRNGYFTPDEWRCLAATPLDPTVVSILLDAELFVTGMKMTGGQWRLAGSVESWIAAGRPGRCLAAPPLDPKACALSEELVTSYINRERKLREEIDSLKHNADALWTRPKEDTMKNPEVGSTPAPRQMPTVGRIVLYTLTKWDTDQIRFRRQQSRVSPADAPPGVAQFSGNDPHEGECVPLIIARVWPGEFPANDGGPAQDGVNGQAILDGNDTHWVTSATEDAREIKPGEPWVGEPGTWRWPVR